MKSKELREGNKVLNDGIVNTVYRINRELTTINTPQGNMIDVQTKLLKGVPLTEERLEKFGFEKMAGRMWCINYSNKHSGFFIKVWNNGVYECRIHGTNLLDNCKYVHKLQNLYYASIEKELNEKKIRQPYGLLVKPL